MSALLAGHFAVHLQSELKKPAHLLEHITREGIPFHKLTLELLHRLEVDFPEDLQPGKLPRVNLFERWWAGMRSTVRYGEATFKLHNLTTYARLLDLRDGTDASAEMLGERVSQALERGTYNRSPLTYEMFYASEGRFYEIIRDALAREGIPPGGLRILARQHEFINRRVHRYFDEALKRSLDRARELLLTVLPDRIAREWQENGTVRPTMVSRATVLFTDIVGFTNLAEVLSPEELLAELDRCFSHFDLIVGQHGLEKIKTIGDAYMCAGGLLDTKAQHPIDIGLCALRIQEFMRKYRKSRARAGLPVWDLRVGIHAGPVIAGVIGTRRFSYDIWGDTVNLASRMEDAGEARRINVSRQFMESTESVFSFDYRGRLAVKGKGELDMYFLTGIRPELTVRSRGRVPNRKFHELYDRYQPPGC